MSRKDRIKKRYHFLREQGYSAKEANKLKHRSLDVSGFELGERTSGRTYIKKNKQYRETELDYFIDRKKQIKNESVYTNWGNLTQNRPYNEEMLRRARYIAKRDNKTLDYGYYYLYYMFMNNKTNEDMKRITKIDKSFEMYVKSKDLGKPIKNKKIPKQITPKKKTLMNFILFEYKRETNISIMGYSLRQTQREIIIDGKKFDKNDYKFVDFNEVD